MKLLIDTHVAIWLHNEPENVPIATRVAIAGADTVFVSVVSAWEHEQKRRKYPDRLPFSFQQTIAQIHFQTSDFPFSAHRHAVDLPMIHNDPFDRMLIAHALELQAVFVTRDKWVRRYDIETLW